MSVATSSPVLDVSVRQADLLGALRYVAVAIPKRVPVAVLAGVKIEADGVSVTLSGFDYEFAATVTIPAPKGRGSALVNCADLTAAVKTFPKAATVYIAVDDDKVRVGCNGVELTLSALAFEDYPSLPPACADPFAILDAADVAMLPDVCAAAGKDDTLPILTAVHATVADGALTLAATDRYRLHVQELAVAHSHAGLDVAPVLIPADALLAVSKHLKGGTDVTVDRAGARMTFEGTDRTLSVRLLEGEFPKYRSLIPAGPFAYTANADSGVLAAAVAAVTSSAGRLDPVRVTLAGELGVQVEWIGGDSGGARTAVAGSSCEGEALTIAFSPAYLLAALKAAGPGVVTLTGTTPVKPALVRRADRPGFTALVMPVRLEG